MYSVEERQKAVDLYLKYGRNAALTIRELGYPNRHALIQWVREYEKTGELHGKLAGHRGYSEEEKRKAVDFYLEHGKQIKYTLKTLGYPGRTTLKLWIDELAPGNRRVFEGNSTQTRYPDVDKGKAVAALISREGSAAQVAKEFDVRRSALYNWKKQLADDITVADMRKEHDGEIKVVSIAEAQEIIRRYEENIARLKEENAALDRDLYKKRIEVAVLEKAAEVIKKDEGISLEKMTNKEKALVIDALRKDFPLKDLLLVMCISKSSYCYDHNALANDKYRGLRKQIHQVFDDVDGRYGSLRIWMALRRMGITVSEKVVRRIMKEEKLLVRSVKKKKYSSYKGEISPAVPNLIERDFHADKPNEKRLTDITEFSIPAGKVYLSPLVDCYDGMVVSWTIGTSPNAELANRMLSQGIATLQENEHPVIHSDRGCHYQWPGWIELMSDPQLVRSMSRKGCSPDNSACEGFFGRLKNEMFYKKDWKGWSIEQFIEEVDTYIHWYNEKRIKMSLGGKSPLEFRKENFNNLMVV